ncbi:MAG: hypothetical protein ABSF16_17480 [Terracidiphilus sp.]|jgi:hypothetical protein
MKQILLFLLAILLFHPGVAAFSQQGGYYPKGGPDSGVEDVSMIQLIANPQVYDNKRVRITGFLHLEFEGDAIYLHREDFSYALTKNALWVNIPRDMTKEQMKAVNNYYVICTGRFRAGMHGHMGLNSGEVDEITRLEVWCPQPRSGTDSFMPPPPKVR